MEINLGDTVVVHLKVIARTVAGIRVRAPGYGSMLLDEKEIMQVIPKPPEMPKPGEIWEQQEDGVQARVTSGDERFVFYYFQCAKPHGEWCPAFCTTDAFMRRYVRKRRQV